MLIRYLKSIIFKPIIAILSNSLLIIFSLNCHAADSRALKLMTSVPDQVGFQLANVLHVVPNTSASYTLSCGTGSLTSQQFLSGVLNGFGTLYYFCSQPYVPANPVQNALYGSGGTLSKGWVPCGNAGNESCTSQFNTVPVTQFQISTQDPLWQKNNVSMTLTSAGTQGNPTYVSSIGLNGGSCSMPSANTYQYYYNNQDSGTSGAYWGRWTLNAQPGLYSVSLRIWRDGGWSDSCSGTVTLTPDQMGKICYPTCTGNCPNCAGRDGNMTWDSVTWTCN